MAIVLTALFFDQYLSYYISTYWHMNKKTEKKKQEKVIQDRTFGLKNKNKSKTVQKFVKGVEQTIKFAGVSMQKLEADQFERRKQKKKEQQEQALLSALYTDVNKLKEAQNSDEDDDPANTVCPYFKQGLCQKGKKCIYSHDLTLDRTEEIDLYVDQRIQLIMNAIGGKELNELSEDELGKMIGEKQKEMIKGAKSDIICKFFLQAAEKDKYGWNWNCPNSGDRCKYKHCLPPGYRLKRDAGKVQLQHDKVDIEAKIDEERNKLLSENRSSPLVTYDIFMKWKEERRIKKEAEFQRKREEEQKKNKNKGQLRTGRELFMYDRNIFVDDEQAAAEYEQEQIVEQQVEQEKQEKIYNQEGEQDLQKPEKEQETEQQQEM